MHELLLFYNGLTLEVLFLIGIYVLLSLSSGSVITQTHPKMKHRIFIECEYIMALILVYISLQDGSCNGLQHYAALGRDWLGAKQVNLVPVDRPQDPYAGVAGMVTLSLTTSFSFFLSFFLSFVLFFFHGNIITTTTVATLLDVVGC